MRSSLLFSMFIILAMIGAVLPGTIVHAQDGIVPLSYKDSRSQLIPGYRVDVEMRAEGAKWISGYSFAGAAIRFGGVEIGFTADPPGWGGLGAMKVYAYAMQNGQLVWKHQVDEIRFNALKEYDGAIELYMDCQGNVHVTFSWSGGDSGAWQHTFTGLNPPLEIWFQAGSAGGTLSPKVTSSVTVGNSVQVEHCYSGPGQPPSPGQGYDPGKHEGASLDLPWKWLALGVIALLIILLIKF